MKLRILSDLHLEMSSWTPPRVDADVVILAGDIWTGTRAIEWAKSHFAGLPVLYVPGNHEFYGENISTLPGKLRDEADGSNVEIMIRKEVILGGVRFLGCTLWTDYRLYSGREPRAQSRAIDQAKSYMRDHKVIRYGSNFERFSPHHALRQHDLDKQFLTEKLAEPFDGKTVVITHHLPSEKSVPMEFVGDDLTPAYASHLEALMQKVDLWVHGHTHGATQYNVGNTRVVCNPRGYETNSGREHTGWNDELVVEV